MEKKYEESFGKVKASLKEVKTRQMHDEYCLRGILRCHLPLELTSYMPQLKILLSVLYFVLLVLLRSVDLLSSMKEDLSALQELTRNATVIFSGITERCVWWEEGRKMNKARRFINSAMAKSMTDTGGVFLDNTEERWTLQVGWGLFVREGKLYFLQMQINKNYISTEHECLVLSQ